MDISSVSSIINSLRRAMTNIPEPTQSPASNDSTELSSIARYSSSSDSDAFQHLSPENKKKKAATGFDEVDQKNCRQVDDGEVSSCGYDKFIASKAVRKCLGNFHWKEEANLGKASRWYKDREDIMSIPSDEVICVYHFVK